MRGTIEKPCIAANRVAAMYEAKADQLGQTAEKKRLGQFRSWLHAVRLQVCEWVP